MSLFERLMQCPRWLTALALVVLISVLAVILKDYASMSSPPTSLHRNMRLKAFEPYRTSFTCVHEADKVPPIDPQAQQWFEQALEMTGGERWPRNYDYPGAFKLYEQAAERKHWKAMLNLANAYMRGLGTERDEEKAVQLVEQAMGLGIPAAFDVMGTWHMYGLGVRQDATRAYAFWQLAADMGNPDSQTYLATHMDGDIDNPEQAQWANYPIAVKMMECAYAQGSAKGAYEYGVDLFVTKNYAKSLQVLHDGVKFGSDECAGYLFASFDDGDALVGNVVDQVRARRYSVLGDALRRNRDLRFPNLDKVLPLPPADLPVWDGDPEHLENAAKAIEPAAPKSPQSQRTGRAHIPEGHRLVLEQRNMQVEGLPVPWQLPSAGTVLQAGYWQPIAVAYGW